MPTYSGTISCDERILEASEFVTPGDAETWVFKRSDVWRAANQLLVCAINDMPLAETPADSPAGVTYHQTQFVKAWARKNPAWTWTSISEQETRIGWTETNLYLPPQYAAFRARRKRAGR